MVVYALHFGLAFGMRSANAANSSMPMMNAAGLGGLGSISSTPSLYSINNMTASLLAQSKFLPRVNCSNRMIKRTINYCHWKIAKLKQIKKFIRIGNKTENWN